MSDGELDDLIRAALERQPRPLSASAVHRALPRRGRPKEDLVGQRLRALSGEGVVHPWPGGRAPRFSTRTFESHLRSHVLTALGQAPRTITALRKGVPSAGHPALARTLEGLVREGKVHRHPPARRGPYALEPPDEFISLRGAVDRLIKAHVRKGHRREAVIDAIRHHIEDGGRHAERSDEARPSEVEPIRAAILALNPGAAQGALVYVPHLWAAMGDRFRDKQEFDRAMLAGLARGQIELQSHPVPSQLSAEEREGMVPDGRGSYFMAVGLVNR